MAIWLSKRLGNEKISEDKRPINVKALVCMIFVTAIIFTATILLSQPMCPKAEQKTIHVPAIKGETSMTSHEAYDYVVCVKQGVKP